MWSQLKSGSRKAFATIYDMHYNSLYHYGRSMTPDVTMIEDAIQDVFVNLWKKKESVSDTDNIRAYLIVSVRHKLLKLIKKQKRYEPNADDQSFLLEESSIEDQLVEEDFQLELRSRLKDSFNLLTGRQRQAVFLRYQESMAYEDICHIMEINYQSVRNLISSGIKKMAEDLKKKI